MQHESLCWCLQIEVVRTHSVVEIVAFSLSFMSFFPSLLPSRKNFRVEGRVSKNEIEFFFSFSYKMSKEKQVKLLKIDFQKM
jgi:hypothetical protein